MIQNLVMKMLELFRTNTNYQSRYNKMVVIYESLKGKIDEVEKKLSGIITRREVLGHFIKSLKERGKVIIKFKNSRDVRCGFKDGSLIELNI